MTVAKYPELIDIGWIDPGYTTGKFTLSIAAAAADMSYFGCMGRIHRVPSSLPARGRNMVVEAFLQGESQWLWFVDSDMVFDKGHVMKLWETAQDCNAAIVSGLAFIFRQGGQPVPSYFVESTGKFYAKGELHLVNVIPESPAIVAATGLASTLIHREVFERMEPARDDHYRWFDQIPIANNAHLSGEDTQFFLRARDLGYETVLDPNAETWHIKEIGIGKADFHRFWELRETLQPDPA